MGECCRPIDEIRKLYEFFFISELKANVRVLSNFFGGGGRKQPVTFLHQQILKDGEKNNNKKIEQS